MRPTRNRIQWGLRLALALLIGVAGGSGVAEGDTRKPGWSYRVRVERDLSSARVLLQFRGYAPKRLVLSRLDALSALRVEPLADGQPGFRTNPARNGIVPREPDRGLMYQVDFRALARLTRADRQTVHIGKDLLTRPALFLLRPVRWPKDAQVEVIFELPTGLEVAVPWLRDVLRSTEERQPVYVLPKHALAAHTRMAIGRFQPRRVKVTGGDLVYYALDAPRRATDAGIARWLQVAMGAVAELYGKPPVDRTHVIVQPHVPGRGRPVVFGRATRSGGPLIHVMLSGTTTDAEMPGEWITVHELLHLGMPFTTLADRWFGEGFVSYYQEVVRARAGILTPQQAWQNLHAWMQRGRASGGRATLAEESRTMTMRYAYHRVYWGGAALALKMDARIRAATQGRRSLDDAMRLFAERHITPGTTIDALELMRLADAHLGVKICEATARRALASRAFPDVRDTYTRLGLTVRNGRVVMLPNALGARDRDAIMRRGGR